MEPYDPWKKCGDLRFHDLSPLSSPLRIEEKEYLEEGRDVMVTASVKNIGKKIEKPWPKEYLKGLYGEIAAARAFRAGGFRVVDANQAFQRNVAGIDHIVGYGSFCFSQSKIFISGVDEKACAEAYERAIDDRFEMAKKFVKFIYSYAYNFGSKGTYDPAENKKIDALEKIADKFAHKKLDSVVAALRKIKKPAEEQFDTSHALIKLIGNAIVFPVPDGIYDAMGLGYQERAFKIANQKKFFEKILRSSYYINDNRKISRGARAKVKDPDFTLKKLK